MSTYSQIFGGKVNVLASDPTDLINGQVWYNSTSKILKFSQFNTGAAWQTSGNLNTARNGLGGAGTQTAALAFGGSVTVNQSVTEEYDGTSWTSSGNMATPRRNFGSAGTQTAGLGFGGYSTTVVSTNT